MSKVCCAHDEVENHNHKHENSFSVQPYIPVIISFTLLLTGIICDFTKSPELFQNEYFRLIWYSLAYILVGFPVIKSAFDLLKKKDFFNEFSLMTLATLGAFALKEYPEGVAVMLFYNLGELFQSAAVNKARNNIKTLLDVRPKEVTVFRSNQWKTLSPEEVEIGEKIRIKAGEKVALDGVLLSDFSRFNTSALSGESKPKTIRQNEKVLAGMLNLEKVIEIEVDKRFEDSSLSKILHLVQEAASRKAKTELFIRKFAKIYTPAVFFLALALVVFPYFIVENYQFKEWLYRALVFLVISCPCALVISIPLGYFGGIGAASRNGILFKGSNFLDTMAKVNSVILDKTGTLTKGVFAVQKVYTVEGNEKDFLDIVSAIEAHSTHPIAKAITSFHFSHKKAENCMEFSGLGLKAEIDGREVLAGNSKWMKKMGVSYDKSFDEIVETIVLVGINGKFAGYITIADELKEDAQSAISEMKKNGVKHTVLLSGDKDSIVQKVKTELKIDLAYGNLLPEEKVEKMQIIKNNPEVVVAFVGDGINDAPVLAMSDVGIAMGGMGSDLAIETADVVIQTDQVSKIATAIKIGKKTKQIVIQNIILAFGVKIIVLFLGAGGIATMWEAVFADVGVALLAILNAVRIQRMKF
ncbi:MAG: heavy metal translocating P-type ATPase [Weeksellaceae bacterium]|nr:heavy metal translocating P-type ATPase [Weeksellaceae bacterium]